VAAEVDNGGTWRRLTNEQRPTVDQRLSAAGVGLVLAAPAAGIVATTASASVPRGFQAGLRHG
jgi:hypothetical protein